MTDGQNCSGKSFVADLGVRYMFNKFGLKADLVTITSKMEVFKSFDSKYYRDKLALQTWERT
jgi:hypothetical protein